MIAAVQAIQYSPLEISRPRPLIPGSVSEVSPQVRIQGGSISAILSPTSPYRSRDYSPYALGTVDFRQLPPILGGRLHALRFAADPLDNPHPVLCLVAYRFRRPDVLRRGDLFGGQAKQIG